MNVFQILPTISLGDAVGNDTIALKKVIAEMGYKTEIYAENVDSRLKKGTAKSIKDMPKLSKNDCLIYHKSTGTRLSFDIEKFGGRKMMIYHNITPPEFFRDYDPNAEKLTEFGYQGVRFLSNKVEYCMAVSSYNRQNLIDMGYKCPIDIRPILIPFKDYEATPDRDTIEKYSDGMTNIIFVGRIAPNKKQEDVIRTFCYYKKHINPNSRLIFVGSYTGMENYYERLQKYISELELEDVVFPGHIKFSEILAFYNLADVFLCMSEHEGFCVPLVEAMYFKLPIIAFASSAIPDTLGGSGLLTETKDPVFNAMLLDRLVSDKALQQQIIDGQLERLKDFSYEKIKETFTGLLQGWIGGKK